MKIFDIFNGQHPQNFPVKSPKMYKYIFQISMKMPEILKTNFLNFHENAQNIQSKLPKHILQITMKILKIYYANSPNFLRTTATNISSKLLTFYQTFWRIVSLILTADRYVIGKLNVTHTYMQGIKRLNIDF